MSTDRNGHIDAARRNLSERENHVIDEFRNGGLSRRDFIRAASVVGISLPFAGLVAGTGSAEAVAKKTTANLERGEHERKGSVKRYCRRRPRDRSRRNP